MGNIARKFLCAPLTTVQSEWLFYGVGNLYDEQKNSPEHAEMLLSIKYKYLFD